MVTCLGDVSDTKNKILCQLYSLLLLIGKLFVGVEFTVNLEELREFVDPGAVRCESLALLLSKQGQKCGLHSDETSVELFEIGPKQLLIHELQALVLA